MLCYLSFDSRDNLLKDRPTRVTVSVSLRKILSGRLVFHLLTLKCVLGEMGRKNKDRSCWEPLEMSAVPYGKPHTTVDDHEVKETAHTSAFKNCVIFSLDNRNQSTRFQPSRGKISDENADCLFCRTWRRSRRCTTRLAAARWRLSRPTWTWIPVLWVPRTLRPFCRQWFKISAAFLQIFAGNKNGQLLVIHMSSTSINCEVRKLPMCVVSSWKFQLVWLQTSMLWCATKRRCAR